MTQNSSTDHAATLRMWEVAMNSIPEMVSVLGEDEVYRVVNDAWCRTMRRRREDSIGRTATELFGLTAPTERLRAVHDCLREHRSLVIRGPSQLPYLDGRVFEATYTPHSQSDAGVRCVVVVTRDVTEQDAQRQAVTASSDYLRRTLDATGEGIFASDATAPDQPVRFVNQRLLEIWGIPLVYGNGLTPARILEHAAPLFIDRAAELARIQQIVAQNLTQTDRLQLRDGRTLLRRCVAASEPGGTVRVWSFRDITVETEALRGIQQAEAATRSLFESFPGLMGVLDEDLRYTFINEPMVELLQRPREAILGHSVEEVLGAARAVEVHQLAATARRNGVVINERQLGERHLQLTLSAHTDQHSGATRYHGYGVDITGLKQAEQALINARDESERANRAKSQFLSHMSHELRTPLNAILGFAQVLDGDATLSPTQHVQTGEILRGARHLLTLINDVLDLGSIEAGKLALEMAPLSLAEVVHECVRLVEPLARERQVQLDALDERSLAHQVSGDRLRLKQVLLNLLANAIKYNRLGGSVSLRCSARRKTLRLVVADTGPGMDAAQQERLFAAFERVHVDHASVEGTGIGLALSKRLMLAMGGDIGVVSAPGAGSRFWIELPLLTRRAAAGAPHEVPDTNTMPLTGVGPRTVLYIEDNPVNIVLMEAMLMRMPGVTMISETMPLAGIDRAAAAPPDLILLDIQLPGLSGFEVLDQLRTLPATRRIPVIAVSANAMPADIDAGRAAGFFDYLTKPVELATLLATVEAALHAVA